MNEESINVAKAKKHLFELLGRVAYGKQQILITKRGKPMARLVPVENGSDLHLGYVKGWLEDDDPFFNVIERIIKKRSMRIPRILK
jgi:prevent-host-death family protein